MKKSLYWTTIVEAMVVMLIIITWVVWAYNIFWNSMKLSDSTEYKLTAISIAREWIEAVTNIRDTNWLVYWANTNNCWFTNNYDSSCITNNNKNFTAWSYLLYNNSNNRWYLSSASTTATWFSLDYRNTFRVKKDANWFYTQSWGTNFSPIFTREIKISYPITWTPPQEVNIESIVRWVDNSSSNYHEVKLQTTLTNWKKD